MLDAYVVNVFDEVAGSELSADASAAATTITVVDLMDFNLDPEGGSLKLDDGTNNETLTYTVPSGSTGTINLGAGLANSYLTGTKVTVLVNGSPITERWADLREPDGEELLRTLVPHQFRPLVRLGPRNEDTGAAEHVRADYEDADLVIQDVLGVEPSIDMAFADTTNSQPSDNVPPGTSPEPTVQGALGALVVQWDASVNADPVTYEVHVSASTGFAPDATTLSQEVAGTIAWIRTLPDGTPLDYNTTYYVQLVAKDVDGSAGASAEAAGQPAQTNSPDIAANAILAQHILAGEVTAEKLAAIIIIASAIKTAESGQRVEIDTDGIKWYDSSGNLGIVFPTQTGQPAIIDANIVAAALDMTGPANFRDAGNTLDVGSILSLQATLTNPGVAPSVGVNFQQLALTGGDAAQVVGTGLFYTATGGAAGSSTTFYASQDTASGSVLEEYGAAFGVLNRTLFTAPAGETIYGAVQASVSSVLKIFVLTGIVFGGVFIPKLYRLDNATLAQEVTHALVGNTGFASGGTFANDAAVGSVAWTSPSSAGASDNVWARAISAGGSASTSYKSPGTAVDDASVGTVAWSFPEAVKAHDGFDAIITSTPAATSHYLKATNFGFSVPVSATITGVVVEIVKETATGTTTDNIIKLVKGGSVVGTNKATGTSWPSFPASYTAYGGSSDTWGLTLTPSDINAASFGVVVSAAAAVDAAGEGIDHIRIKVYYTTATSQTTQFLKATNFGFSVPANATITGVSAQIERHAPGDITDNTVKLVKGGAVSGNDEALAVNWPATDAIAAYGGSSDLWGLALTPSDVNASNFGIVVSATGTDDAFIDNIQLKVFYRELQNSTASGAAELGLVGTNPAVISYSSTSRTAASVARLFTISKTNLQVTATQDLSGKTYTPADNDPRFAGLVDDGTSLWVSVRADPTHGNLNHRYNSGTFAYETNHDFSGTGFFNRGLTWDGTRLWSRSAGAPNLAKHTTWDWTTENPNYWIAYTWYNATAPGTFTVTIASPAVFTYTNHGLVAGDPVYFTTTGALPTGLTANTTYYVIAAGLTANAFEVSTTPGGSAVNTSGTQSGTHTLNVIDETIVSPRTQIDLTNLRRARLLITVPPFPSGITKARVYVARNATAPATTALKLQAPTTYVDTDSSVSIHEIDFNGSGAAPPTVSGFTVGTPAELRSTGVANTFPWRLKGDDTFKPPAFTTTQRDAIASPPAGDLIFNFTTSKLNFYDGSVWRVVTST